MARRKSRKSGVLLKTPCDYCPATISYSIASPADAEAWHVALAEFITIIKKHYGAHVDKESVV